MRHYFVWAGVGLCCPSYFCKLYNGFPDFCRMQSSMHKKQEATREAAGGADKTNVRLKKITR